MITLIALLLLIILCVVMIEILAPKPGSEGAKQLVKAVLWAAVFAIVLSLAHAPQSLTRW